MNDFSIELSISDTRFRFSIGYYWGDEFPGYSARILIHFAWQDIWQPFEQGLETWGSPQFWQVLSPNYKEPEPPSPVPDDDDIDIPF